MNNGLKSIRHDNPLMQPERERGALSSFGLTTGSPLGCQGASEAEEQLIDLGVFRFPASVAR
jgi:hypothetical protein